jgi:hypothetical protein
MADLPVTPAQQRISMAGDAAFATNARFVSYKALFAKRSRGKSEAIGSEFSRRLTEAAAHR